MKSVNTSQISTSVGFPVKSGTLQHLQASYKEVLDAIVRNLIGREADTTNAYILFGCVNSTPGGSTFTISAGAIYFNGEVYLVDAATITVSGGNVIVGTITTTQFSAGNADPVTFTDGSTKNVHDIKKIVWSAAASGSGAFDFSSLTNTLVPLLNVRAAALGASYTINFKQDQAIFFPSVSASPTITFDFTNAVPGTVVRLKFVFGSALTLTVNQPAGSTVINDTGVASSGAGSYLLYAVYLGRNASSNHEVSYQLIKYA